MSRSIGSSAFSFPRTRQRISKILSALLDRYPVVVADEAASEPELGIIEASPQMKPTNIIDLGQWIVAVGEGNFGEETANDIDLQPEREALALETGAEEVPSHEATGAAFLTPIQQNAPMPWLGQATSATQLALNSSEILLSGLNVKEFSKFRSAERNLDSRMNYKACYYLYSVTALLNRSSSVKPAGAVVDEVPPAIAFAIASKYPVPTNDLCAAAQKDSPVGSLPPPPRTIVDCQFFESMQCPFGFHFGSFLGRS